MNKWLICLVSLSLFFLMVLKAHEVNSLQLIFKSERSIKLKAFSEAKAQTPKNKLDLLKLWESILTGRSAPVARHMKERYKALGLNHIFTPSGFHLSAALFPFMSWIRSPILYLFLLSVIGTGLVFLPGLGALKRMVLIKGTQKLVGIKTGFVCAMILDMFWGTFQTQPLSFTYSMLFIGIIYSGQRGLKLIIWFFLAQALIAFFQGNELSLLILVFSPVLNLIFSLLMPVLLLLSFPLWTWQLKLGLWLLSLVQALVDICAGYCLSLPTLEVNVGLLFLLIAVVMGHRNAFIFGTAVFCSSLNPNMGKLLLSSSLYRPRGPVTEVIYDENYVKIHFLDGKCRMKLVEGYWVESCFPSRGKRSSKRRKIS